MANNFILAISFGFKLNSNLKPKENDGGGDGGIEFALRRTAFPFHQVEPCMKFLCYRFPNDKPLA